MEYKQQSMEALPLPLGMGIGDFPLLRP